MLLASYYIGEKLDEVEQVDQLQQAQETYIRYKNSGLYGTIRSAICGDRLDLLAEPKAVENDKNNNY